ncbi:hypothetical protein GCM10008013_49710 [Paenibacillus segetis]|uniref:Uncharacterized protein n=1 Tax=Paenibacillus segetis TaxID=1325360 RepID=A0ABQ1YY38_9BACL|nr:hypothetical protein GCM10008013_49710 [Paenibacillus segetis]
MARFSPFGYVLLLDLLGYQGKHAADTTTIEAPEYFGWVESLSPYGYALLSRSCK